MLTSAAITWYKELNCLKIVETHDYLSMVISDSCVYCRTTLVDRTTETPWWRAHVGVWVD